MHIRIRRGWEIPDAQATPEAVVQLGTHTGVALAAVLAR